ncbi:(2Fe-2S)-binding protein [Larkinella sp. VNQ87]|uniref:(2Fe-2S)-binding protein n=1 Tax=Larkinella sp. VNQ87 TaxID=3400921 RepID=UPI003BFB448A
MKKATLTIEVNRQRHTVEVDPATPLLYVLRNNLRLNGPKYGCGLEQCGACMVLLNGKAMPSCLVPVETVRDKSIVTLEGLTRPDGKLSPVQRAFVEQQAAQCGYCLNGMVISATALLAENKQPDETAIRQGMQRVLCRCGTQSRVLRAIRQAANESNP